jgi:GPI ethanolamine phosphate transferase 1
MFAKGSIKGRVVTKVCTSEREVVCSQSAQTYLLDKWVFDQVKKLLSSPETVGKMKKQTKLVFFLHLLGIDTSGHIHKPHSQLEQRKTFRWR